LTIGFLIVSFVVHNAEGEEVLGSEQEWDMSAYPPVDSRSPSPINYEDVHTFVPLPAEQSKRKIKPAEVVEVVTRKRRRVASSSASSARASSPLLPTEEDEESEPSTLRCRVTRSRALRRAKSMECRSPTPPPPPPSRRRLMRMSGAPVLSAETQPDPRLKKGKSVSFAEGQSKSAPSSPYPVRGQAGDGYVYIAQSRKEAVYFLHMIDNHVSELL